MPQRSLARPTDKRRPNALGVPNLFHLGARLGLVFVTERGAQFTRSGFAKMVARAGEAAGFAFPVHMHMLRHACGYYYANRGEDTRSLQLWLGHKSIQHTVKYTQLSAERFKDW